MPSGFPCIRRLASLFLTLAVLVTAAPDAHALEKATLQLKWLHHFQFAGYYAALEKGFYREAGLDVTILEGGPAAEVEKDVATGQADFGTGTSALLLDLARGEELVVVGQVFQHSPAIFLTPRKTGIRSVSDMTGKRFMYSNQHGDMRALLKKYGIDENQIIKTPHKGDPRDLIEGKADVMLAYNFNEPYMMELAGEPYFTFSPLSFGIDFYGDNFFTARKTVENRPEFVEAFREASLRGWRYALENKKETVRIIHTKYAKNMSREHLLFEADNIDALVQPNLVELGYQSRSRWQRISETYSDLGMLPKGFDPATIIYTPKQSSDHRMLIYLLLIFTAIISALGWLAYTFRSLSIKLRKQIEDRLNAESMLRDALGEAQRFRSALDHISSFIYMKDTQSRYVYANEATLKLFGCSAEELPGCSDSRFFPEDVVNRLHEVDSRVLQGEQTAEEIYVADSGGGHRVYFEIKTPIYDQSDSSIVWGLLGISTDITALKLAEEEHLNLERQLLHAQKLESLGVLAGGIAHDFNNILTAIIGNAELALMRINAESPVVENLKRIGQSAARAADLAKQMLAYSGKGRFVVEKLNLNRLLEELLQMLEVSISKKAVLRFNLTKDPPIVEADASQIRQVIMNLVINASEAIGDSSGVITITTSCIEYKKNQMKDVWQDESLSDGLYQYLEVADTGCGMDMETLGKLFDPFFTTKFTGRGLGMSAVQGIIRGHRGAITVSSEPGKGSSFKILLPVSVSPGIIVSTDEDKDDWHGSGTVLLVDDEEPVRRIGDEMLRKLGFETITANDGKDALELFKANPGITLVILDLTMPQMGGEQCFMELQKVRPDVKVIISSGYSEEDVTQRFTGKQLAGFILKPYKLSVLKEVIRRIV